MSPTDQQRQIIADLCNANEIPIEKRALFEAEVINALMHCSDQGGDLNQQVMRAFSDAILGGGRQLIWPKRYDRHGANSYNLRAPTPFEDHAMQENTKGQRDRNLGRTRPGPKPRTPTAAQRRRIMRGIAIGLTLDELAADIGMPLGSMRRVFATEIRLGRVRSVLENLERLHAAADDGNVSAMKALARMMCVEPAENGDTWADVIDAPANLSRNVENQDLH
jgi:hypothetical protein